MDHLIFEKSKNADSMSISSQKRIIEDRSFLRYLFLLSLFVFVFGCASDLKTDLQKYVPTLKSAKTEDSKKKDPLFSAKKEVPQKKKSDSKSKDSVSKESKNPFTSLFALKKSSDSLAEEAIPEKRKGSINDLKKKDPAETPEKLLDNGNRAYLEGKFYEAAFAYKRWLKIKDENSSKETVALVYSRLGEIAQQQTRYQIAMDCFESAVKYSEAKNAKYLFLAGKAHFDLGNYVKAEEKFAKILLISPDYEKIHYHYGLTLLNQEKFEEAQRYLVKDLGEAETFHLLAEKAYELKKMDLARELENKMKIAAQQRNIPVPMMKNRPAGTSTPNSTVQKNNTNVPKTQTAGLEAQTPVIVPPLPTKTDKLEITRDHAEKDPSSVKKDPVLNTTPQKIISAAKAPSALPPFPTLSPVFPVKNESEVKTVAAQKPLENGNLNINKNNGNERYEKEIPQLPSLPDKKGEESTLVKSLLAETPKKTDPIPVVSAAPVLPAASAEKKPTLGNNKNPITVEKVSGNPELKSTTDDLLSKQSVDDEIIVYAPNELFAIKMINRNSEEAKKILVQYGVIIPLKQYKTSHLYPARPKITDLMKPQDQPEKIASLPQKSLLVPERTSTPVPAKPVSAPSNLVPASDELPKAEKQIENEKRFPVPAPFAQKNIPLVPAPIAKEPSQPLSLPGPVDTRTQENPVVISPSPFPVVNLNFPKNTTASKLPHAINTSAANASPLPTGTSPRSSIAGVQKVPVDRSPLKEEVQLPDLDPSEIKDSVRIAELEKLKKDPSAFDENSDFGFAESRQYTLTTLPESYAKELGKSEPEDNSQELKKQLVASAPQTDPRMAMRDSHPTPSPKMDPISAPIVKNETPATEVRDLAQMENRILLTPKKPSNVKQVAAVESDPNAKVVPIPAKAAVPGEKKESFWSNPFKSIRIPNFWSEEKK